jgi:hypothetical protein
MSPAASNAANFDLPIGLSHRLGARLAHGGGSWFRNSSLRICNPHQLNLKRNADVKATGANHRGCAMLAEIFMIRLEAVARAAKEAANSPRFVPVTLPAAKAS